MIARKSFLIFITSIISMILGFISIFFLTRYLGPEDYGIIAWTISFIAIFNVASDLGTGYAHIKRVSEGQDINACVSTFAVFRIGMTAIVVIICLVSVFIYNLDSGNQFSGDALIVLLILLLYQVFIDLIAIAKTTFDARLITSKSQLIGLVDPLIRTPLIIIVLISGFGGVIQVTLVYLIGGIAASIVAIFLFSREHIKWQKPTLLRSYASFAFPLAIASVAGIFVANVDKLLLGFFWTKADVAFYSSSLSLLLMIGIIGTVVSFIAFPVFSMLHKDGRHEDIKHRVKQAERYISMISLPAIIIFVLFPDITSRVVFGSSFAPAAKTLPYLAISIFCYQLNQIACSHIMASNRVRILAKLTWLHLGILIGLLLLFVPTNLLGIGVLGLAYEGAAIANMLAMITIFTITRLYIWKVANIGIYLRLYLHVLAAVGVSVLLFMLSKSFPVDTWYLLGFYCILSFLSFFVILFSMKELTRKDVKLFLDVASISKMKDYIKGEY